MRRWFVALVAVLGMAGAGVVVAAAPAAAVTPGCVVVNTTSPVRTFTGSQALANAVTAASAGDTLFVKGTCTGNTEISKDLTLTGHSSSGTKTATLNGGGTGTVLVIDAGVTVTINTLTITGGNSPGGGGGIRNVGTTTLNNSSITGNHSGSGGGIENGATITLNNSSITGNTAFEGGGIDNAQLGIVTLNGSSITGNTATNLGGGIYTVGGLVTLNGSTIITGNTAKAGPFSGGGIFNNSSDELAVSGATATNITGNTPDNCGGLLGVIGCVG